MSSQSSFESAADSLSQHLSEADLPDTQGASVDQVSTKENSPAPPTSSITPPPSTQTLNPRHAILSGVNGDITPTYSALSSPPPTGANGYKRDGAAGATIPRLTSEELAGATNADLRKMLEVAAKEKQTLQAKLAESRMTAAHYKLQHNLLSIESEEVAKRMEVEHEMTRREVDVLQHAFQSRESPNQDYIAKLKNYCYAVEEDNKALSRRLENAKKIIEAKDDELASVKEKEERLLTRIRENREHLNYLRSPGGIFHIATPKPSNNSYPATPQQYRSTPKHTPMTDRSVRQGRDHSQEPFAALLLADRVLSQENNSAPSTPNLSRRADPRTSNKHSRGVQSLSSLPGTPGSGRPGIANSTLLPSVQFRPEAESHLASSQNERERRRKSRDSTISVSDNEELTHAEEMARAVLSSFREESEEVPESQASQNAAEMLRIDPRESFEVAASRNNTPTPSEKSNLLQSKIFGTVTKGVAEKRKRGDDEVVAEYPTKKLRAGPEGISLGIGFEPRA